MSTFPAILKDILNEDLVVPSIFEEGSSVETESDTEEQLGSDMEEKVGSDTSITSYQHHDISDEDQFKNKVVLNMLNRYQTTEDLDLILYMGIDPNYQNIDYSLLGYIKTEHLEHFFVTHKFDFTSISFNDEFYEDFYIYKDFEIERLKICIDQGLDPNIYVNRSKLLHYICLQETVLENPTKYLPVLADLGFDLEAVDMDGENLLDNYVNECDISDYPEYYKYLVETLKLSPKSLEE